MSNGNDERCGWVIAVCNTNCDGVDIYKFYGTVDEVKNKLVSLVIEGKNEDEDSWDYGNDTTEDVKVVSSSELYAFGCYYNYHIDYTARKFDSLIFV